MARPRGLEFKDRIAPHNGGWYFVCQRRGHPMLSVWIDGAKKDAEALRAAHDTSHHNNLLRAAGFRPDLPLSVHRVIEEWLGKVRADEVDGKRSPATTAHYEYTCGLLRGGFSAREYLSDIDQSRISALVRHLRRSTHSAGSAIVKSLQTLRKIYKFKSSVPRWEIDYDEIRPEKLEKRDLDAKTIAKFISKLPVGSLELAVVALKARTGARNVEIYEACAGDVDLEEKLFEPLLHAKRGPQKRHVYPLTDDLVAILTPFVAGKDPAERLFLIQGRPLRKESLRRRFVRASEDAKIKPPIRAIKDIRAEVVTVIADETDIATASKFIGHKTTKTTTRWYYKDRRTKAKLEAQRKIAEIVAEAIPLAGHDQTMTQPT